MAQVEDVKVLNIDDVTYAVDALSDEVQAMVALFNKWNVDDNELVGEVNKVRLAKEALSQQIIAKVREDNDAKDNKETEASTPAPAPTDAPPVAELGNDGELGFAD